MVQNKKICALLLLAVLFVGTCESALLCYYIDPFAGIVIFPCPFSGGYSSRSAPASSNNKDCTKESPCLYQGKKS